MLAVVVGVYAQTPPTLPQASASNGGASSNGIYSLRDAIGQVGGGAASNGIYAVNGGFTSVSANPDVIFADNFEAGNMTAWSSPVTDGGDLSVSSAAKLDGAFGLQALHDDTKSIYVTDDKPTAERRYRVRFYFDPNSIRMAANNAYYPFYGYSGSSTVVLRVELCRCSNAYQLRAALLNDATTWSSTAYFTISDAPHVIELDWQAATAAGANNGRLTFWIDNVQRVQLPNIDNDTRRIDQVQLGAVAGMDSGTLGTTYFDAFVSRRQSYIGPAGVLAADAVVTAVEGSDGQVFTSDEPTEAVQDAQPENAAGEQRLYLPLVVHS